jgi:F-type H+-transporting ATPase subunit a
MVTQLPLTRILNHHFASTANNLLAALHIHSTNPQAPINNAFSMELLVFVVLLAYFVAVRLSLNVEKPSVLQHAAEAVNGFVTDQSESIIGHGYERFVSYISALLMFILLCNLIGLIPGLESPTANVVVPLGCALVTFVYYHYHGIRVHGFSYIKQFLGPVWWLYPLMLPIEIISHFARILSLTVRLYANMFAGDLVTLAFFSLIPAFFPALFLGLHFFVALIQAYIFMVLATVYLSMAVAHDH